MNDVDEERDDREERHVYEEENDCAFRHDYFNSDNEDVLDSESCDEIGIFDQESDFEDDFDDSVGYEDTDNGETVYDHNAGEQDDFFPFPDEMFFLLYCYVHNIMRHKVEYNSIA